MIKKKVNLQKIEKLVATFTILFLVLQIVSPVLLYPRKAQAFLGVGDQTFATIVANIPDLIWRAISKTLKTTADVIFRNMIKKYLNQLAYNAAVYVATGEKGQKPMFLTKPGQLLLDVADNTFGDYIDQFARDWSEGTCGWSKENLIEGSKCRNKADCYKYNLEDPEFTGFEKGGKLPRTPECIKPYFSLCEPIDVGFKLKLVLWAKGTQKPTAKEEEINYQAKCPVSGMIKNAASTLQGLNYEQYLRELEKMSPRDYLKEVAKGLNPEASELGQYLIVLGEAEKAKEKKVDLTKFTQALEGPWKSLKTKITGEVLTPATAIGKSFESMMPESIKPYIHQTGSAIADAIGVFFNTLTSKLLKQIYEKGLNPRAKPGGGGGAYAGIPTGGVSTGIAAAESMFASLNKPDYNVSGTTDILSELASCPSPANINNCVIDNQFKLAIEQKKTVRQAIEEGLIDGSKTFGYDAVTQKDPDYRSGYPLRSLLILRKYRIIPVGWELAAKYIKQYAPANFGLKEIMDNYDNCGKCYDKDDKRCYDNIANAFTGILCQVDTDCPANHTCKPQVITGTSCRVDTDCPANHACEPSAASPFCGLVDPNWVLKIPEVYCKREGAGEKVVVDEWITNQLKGDQEVTKDTVPGEEGQIERRMIQRMDYCADEQTCIAENEDGSCRKFGYCVEEKPIWKFHGDQCEAYYNTCQLFSKKSDGTETAYLKNTVDFNNCSADNAGCRWYCEDWNSVEKRWTCEAPKLSAAPPEMVGNRINLNGQVGQCDPKAEGCDEFIRAKRGIGTNLIRNGGFELGTTDSLTVPAAGGVINYWPAFNGGANYFIYKATDDAYAGSASFRIQTTAANQGLYSNDASVTTANSILPEDFYFTKNKSYTLSAYVKITVGAFDAVKIALGSQCAGAGFKEATSVFSSDWQRIVVTFPASENFIDATPCDHLNELRVYSNSAATFYVDAVQLEEGSVATTYKDYGSANKIYLNGQRTACTADEAGCEKYTPTVSGQPINGIITDPSLCNPLDPSSCDQCPAEFVGCKAYREMPIDHLPYRQATDPISLVASSGKTCPASAVGCEEYTNLDEVAKGGEGLEYFGYIRLCVLPTSPNLATYYTWVGTEEFGYQLKSYNLLQTNVLGDNAPCTNIDVDGWPACGDDLGPPSNVADCSDACNIAAGQCNKSGIACTTDQDCLDHALSSDPDCAEFYDQTGDTHYRLKSRIISVSDSCLPYRNTFTSQDRCVDTNADGNPDTCEISGATGCQRDGDCRNEACSGGLCSQTRSVACADSNGCPPKIFHLDPDQGIRCQAEYAGCREYVGSAGHNVYTVLQSNFESGSISPWDTNTNPGLNPSNESIQAGGHSMLVASAGGGVSYANTLVDKLINKNKSYILSFWAKGTGTDTVVSASFVSNPAANWLTPPNLPFSGSAALKAGDWNKYSLGPIYHERDVTTAPTVPPIIPETLYIFSNTAFYIDNIVLEEVTDDIYLIKNSYTQCSGYENCSQYADRDQATHYLKSFSKLCKDDKVGCEAMIDTQNSNSPFKEFYDEKGPRLRGDVNGDGIVNVSDRNILNDYVTPLPPDPKIYPYPEIGDIDNNHVVDINDVNHLDTHLAAGTPVDPLLADLVVQDDRITYAVNDKNKYCKAEEQGCARLGLATINQDNIVTSYKDVHLVNDPDSYHKILCNLAETGCEEYTTPEGQRYYFKDPGDKTCEYRRQAGAESSAWYKNGSNSVTPDCPVVDVGGSSKPALGWVGVCPADKSGCSDYRDPHVPINCDVATAGSCNSYFYINSTIDTTGCNGVFNPDKGCILFADMTQINTDQTIRLTYDSDLTYANFDNTRKDTQPTVCTGIGTCSISANACTRNADCGNNVCFGGTCTISGNICNVDADCGNNVCLSDCDSNTIVKVDRDRTCNKWLDCQSSIIAKNQKGENEEYCYALGVCNELDINSGLCLGDKECSNNSSNHCANTVEEVACKAGGGACRKLDSTKSNLTFNTPADVDSIRYMSGSVVGGLSWASDQTIAGYYPYAAMEQIGLGGNQVDDLVVNGDFGDRDILDGPEPSIDGRDLSNSWTLRTCSNNNTVDCAKNLLSCPGTCTGSMALMEESGSGQIKTGDQDNLDENNILEVNPGRGLDQGVYYKIENGIFGNQKYVVSFRIRYKDEPDENDRLTVGLAYAKPGAPEPAITDFTNFATDLQPTTEFKQYVLGPIAANPKGGATYLRFVRQRPSICPGIETPYVWIVNSVGDTIYRVDSSTGAISGPYSTGGDDPSRTAVDLDGNVWVANRGDGTLSKLNGQTGVILKTCPTGGTGPRGVAIDQNGYVWVATDYNNGTVVQISGDDANCNILRNVDVAAHPYGLAIDGNNNVWVVHRETGPSTVTKIEASTGKISGSFAAGTGAYGIAVDADNNVWVSNWEGKGVTKINGADPTQSSFTSLGKESRAIAIDGYGNAWVTHSYGLPGPTEVDMVTKLDPDGNVLRTISVSDTPGVIDQPIGIAVTADQTIWVVNYDSGKLHRLDNNGSPFDVYDLGAATKAYTYSDFAGYSLRAFTHNLCASRSTGRVFYLDDVSLKPVLEANSDPRCLGGKDDGEACVTNDDCTPSGICYNNTKIVRSCRMYPKSDAPLCSYTDEKAVTYRGWYGYCIEKDPINPQYCLNWWPVDTIAGESNVFGAEEEFSYTGRVPLYMCMQARGNEPYSRNTGADDCKADDNCGEYYGIYNPITTNVIRPFYKSDIEKVTLKVSICDHGGDDESDCNDNGLNLWNSCNPPGEPVVHGGYNLGCNWYFDSGDDCCRQDYTVDFYIPDLYPVPGTQNCNDASDGNCWEPWTIKLREQGDTSYNGRWWDTDNDPNTHANGTWWDMLDDGSECDGGGNKNILGAKLWGTSNDIINRLSFGFCDDSGSSVTMDWYLIVYQRESCNQVVQVASSDYNKAWANRMKSSSNYTVPNLNYAYKQDWSPFGGVVKEPLSNNPAEWDTRPYENDPQRQPLYVESPLMSMGPEGQIRAGSPYSCEGQCGSTGIVGICHGGGNMHVQLCDESFPDCCQGYAPGDTTCVSGIQGVCMSVELPADTGTICDNQANCDINGKEKLKRLFADVIDGWSWNGSSYAPGLASVTAWQNEYTSMTACPATGRPVYNPAAPPSDYCGVPPEVNKIVVKAGDKICNTPGIGCLGEINNNSYAEIAFNVSVNEEQVPLKAVLIDWNSDGIPDQTFTGNYPAGKRTYTYKLSCTACPCDFKPRIRVKDNWDWCNQNNIGAPGVNRFNCNTWYDPDFTFRFSCP